jgi:hypothetical protein
VPDGASEVPGQTWLGRPRKEGVHVTSYQGVTFVPPSYLTSKRCEQWNPIKSTWLTSNTRQPSTAVFCKRKGKMGKPKRVIRRRRVRMQCLPKTPLDFGLPPCTLKFHRGCAFAAVSQELSHNRDRDDRHPSGWPSPIDAARVGSTGAPIMNQAFVRSIRATPVLATAQAEISKAQSLGRLRVFFFCCPESSKRTLDFHMGRTRKGGYICFAKNASNGRNGFAGGTSS